MIPFPKTNGNPLPQLKSPLRYSLLILLLLLTPFLCIQANQAHAQATLLPNGEQQFIDGNGAPYAGGKVYFYVPTTLTPKNTWQNPTESILNTNPVTLDASGRAIIYGGGSYRQILKDSLGNTIWDQLTADASSFLLGNVSIGGNLSVAGTSTLTGNTAVGGTLGVSGLITAGAVTVTSATHASLNGLYLPTTNTPAIDANGLDVTRFLPTVSAVNYLTILGGATGNGARISVDGSDSDIAINIKAKGNGAVNIDPGGGLGLSVANVPSSVDYVQVNGSATGSPVVGIQAAGTDPNISIQMVAKGTGNMSFVAQGATQFLVQNAASAVNQITVFGSATSALSSATVSASGSDSNINLVLASKGSGGVVMGATQTPSHTATCTAGAFWWDTGFIYVCTASGTVKRVALSSF